MATISHQNNFATNLTSDVSAGATTTPLNSIPSVDAPFYLAFDATNINGKYEVVLCTSKTATNVNHAALSNAHTTAEEVRMVIPAAEMNNLATVSTQSDGTWVAFTPSWTNLTVGAGGTNTGFYTQIGKTVHFRTYFKFGTGSAVGTTPTLTLPVAIATYNSAYIGNVKIKAAGLNYIGAISTDGVVIVGKSDGTYLTATTLSATVPGTFTTNDEIHISATYEIA